MKDQIYSEITTEKFRDPFMTAKGDERAVVAFTNPRDALVQYRHALQH